MATGLNGEGTLAINDDPPRPDTPDGTLFSNGNFTIGQALNLQLRAKDLQNDAITFTVLGGGAPFPGVAIASTHWNHDRNPQHLRKLWIHGPAHRSLWSVQRFGRAGLCDRYPAGLSRPVAVTSAGSVGDARHQLDELYRSVRV
jgi:hypothetical protein